MNRKKNALWIIVAGFVLIVGLLYLARDNRKPEEDERYELTMLDTGFDTPVTFQAWGSEQDFVRWLDLVRTCFIENNQIFDQYESYEDVTGVYDLNREPIGSETAVPDQIIECLQTAAEANALYDKFDITQGHLISLWHEFREGNSSLPSEEEIRASINQNGMDTIAVNEENQTVERLEEVWLDFGAIAKGYTVEQAGELLEEAGCSSGYINAGGNVLLIGNKPDGEPWKVGIIKPDSDESLVIFTSQTPLSLVTSGDYQRYVMEDGVRYSHIIDPQTGYPAQGIRSVTVFDQSSTWADAMSTSLFLMSLEDGLEFCRENGLEALWIVDHGQESLEPNLQKDGFDIYFTDGLDSRIELS